jgi:hypothetical protein
MDIYNDRVKEYVTKNKQLDDIRESILECPPLYKLMTRQLCPDLFKGKMTEDEELVWLTKVIDKYKIPSNVPRLPHTRGLDYLPNNIHDQANKVFFYHVQRIVDRHIKRKNRLLKARKGGKK